MSLVEYKILPPRRGVSLDLGELWRYRDLFAVFCWRDISIRYKQTILGFAWAIVQPLFTMIVFTVIFGNVAKISTGSPTVPYPIFVYVGLLFWQFYSTTLSKASESLVTNAMIVQKVYFPRLIIPSAAAATGIIDMGIASVILIGMMFFYHFVPSLLGLAILPILLITVVASALGLGYWTSALNIKYRDVKYLVTFFVQTMMYVTPVVYPSSLLDGHPWLKTLMTWLNPISGVITNARAGLLGGAPIDWSVLGISLFVSLVMFFGGLAYFRSAERGFADLI